MSRERNGGSSGLRLAEIPGLMVAVGVIAFFWFLLIAGLEGFIHKPLAALISIGSFFVWIQQYRFYRKIHDLPTSKIASASQGYVELFGVSKTINDEVLRSPLTQRRCCWYSYMVTRPGSRKQHVVDSGCSEQHFLIVDSTGECVISPDGAEINTSHRKRWYKDNFTYTEWLLVPGDKIYALGELVTTSGADLSAADTREEVNATLTEWKKDRQQLLHRFDTNKDGEIDLKEWEQAREQAIREVNERFPDNTPAHVEGVHLLRLPADGRPFLLANELPDSLGRTHLRSSIYHLAAFFVFGILSITLNMKTSFYLWPYVRSLWRHL